MVDYIYLSGEVLQTGSHGEHDYVIASGEPVPDTGQSDFVFESGTGLGGISVLEDWEDPFSFDRYGGDLTYADRVTSPSWDGTYSGRIGGEPNDNDVGISTRDVILEPPVTLNCRIRVGDGTAALVAFFTQSESGLPECYQVSAEAGDNTFEVEYNDGGGWGGDSTDGGPRQANVNYNNNEWYLIEFGVDSNDDIFARLYDEVGNLVADISGPPTTTLSSGGFGFGTGNDSSGYTYYDNLQRVQE